MNNSNLKKSKTLVANASWRPGYGSQPLNTMPRIRRRMAVIAVLFASIGVMVFINADSLSLRINQPVIKVRMDNQWQRVSDAEVQSMLSNFMGTGFFDLDVLDVKVALEEHPWIRQASVKKVWPNSLGLFLTEEVAIARWGETDLLNQYGQIFRPGNIAALRSLPQLYGPSDSQIRVMEQYRAINQLFFPAGMRVTSLSLSERGSWVLELNNQLSIIAGRENVMERLNRFLSFYGQQSDDEVESMIAVDLRYDNGLAVSKHAEELTKVAVR